EGSDVRISGIKVGSVVGQSLDPKTFLATLRLAIDPAFKLPDDTSAEIVSDGLLGGKYLSLTPGGSDKEIPAGGRIRYTQSSAGFKHLTGQMMSPPRTKNRGEGESGPPRGGAPAGPAPPK